MVVVCLHKQVNSLFTFTSARQIYHNTMVERKRHFLFLLLELMSYLVSYSKTFSSVLSIYKAKYESNNAATICNLPFKSAGTLGPWPSAPFINDAL